MSFLPCLSPFTASFPHTFVIETGHTQPYSTIGWHPGGPLHQGITVNERPLVVQFSHCHRRCHCGLFTLPLFCIKGTGIHAVGRWFSWDSIMPSSPWAQFPIKTLFLVSAALLRIIGWSWGEQNETGLSNAFLSLEVSTTHICRKHSIIKAMDPLSISNNFYTWRIFLYVSPFCYFWN